MEDVNVVVTSSGLIVGELSDEYLEKLKEEAHIYKNYDNIPQLKLADNPPSGKERRRTRRMLELRKRKGRLWQTYLAGREIEFYSSILNAWKPAFITDISSLIKNIDNYRIKPEVKYRPFKNLKECLEEMQCHIPYGWIKTDNNVHRLITLLDEDRTLIGHQETSWTYEKIFECFTFMDGKPFGVRY